MAEFKVRITLKRRGTVMLRKIRAADFETAFTRAEFKFAGFLEDGHKVEIYNPREIK